MVTPVGASRQRQPAGHGGDAPACRKTILQTPAATPKRTQSSRLSKTRLTPAKDSHHGQPAIHDDDAPIPAPACGMTILQHPSITPKKTPVPAEKTPATSHTPAIAVSK
jgi:hypothetical protein